MPPKKESVARRVDRTVGERIRTRRTELGLTQQMLAAAMSISYQQVQKYETGANRISAGRLYEIAQKLEVPVTFFFEGFEPSAPVHPMEHGGRHRAEIEVVRNFADIEDTEVRTAVAGLVRSLAGRQRRRGAA